VVNHISAERAAIGNPSSYTDFHHNSFNYSEMGKITFVDQPDPYSHCSNSNFFSDGQKNIKSM